MSAEDTVHLSAEGLALRGCVLLGAILEVGVVVQGRLDLAQTLI